MDVNKIYHGVCLEILKTFEDNSFDSCVTDPPYGINFMNKHWDYDVPKAEVWQEILRVLKPGAHLLCACGTRTQHRMAVNIEDAGFEIRDVITWHYGSGFPKSLDISKAIDKEAGAERKVVGKKNYSSPDIRGNASNGRGISGPENENKERLNIDLTAPSTESAKQWNGWGTALKPATEFWTLARKPISERTIAANVLKWGTGALNIDGCRVDGTVTTNPLVRNANGFNSGGLIQGEIENGSIVSEGRFPANVILDEFAGEKLDEQTGILTSGKVSPEGFKGDYTANVYGTYANNQIDPATVYGDSGGASRFFYCPKADNFERNKGLKDFDKTSVNHIASESGGGGGWKADAIKNPNLPRANHHPTVKPIDLMRYLVKLITPKRGICLDPYCGSGTTLIGCKLELINYIGIEREEEYCKIAEARVAAWNPDKYIPQKLF